MFSATQSSEEHHLKVSPYSFPLCISSPHLCLWWLFEWFEVDAETQNLQFNRLFVWCVWCMWPRAKQLQLQACVWVMSSKIKKGHLMQHSSFHQKCAQTIDISLGLLAAQLAADRRVPQLTWSLLCMTGSVWLSLWLTTIQSPTTAAFGLIYKPDKKTRGVLLSSYTTFC